MEQMSTAAQQPPEAPPPDGGARRERLTDYDQLRRSRTDRRVAGVAGGLGRHLEVDPTVLRVLLVVLCFFGGAGFVLYAACWLLVPEEGSDHSRLGGASTRTPLLLVAAAVAVLLVVGGWWEPYGAPWPLVVALLLAVALVARPRSTGSTGPPTGSGPEAPETPAAPAAEPWQPVGAAETTLLPAGSTRVGGAPRADRGPLLFAPTLALLAVSLGTLGLVAAGGVDVPAAAYAALAVAVVGLMLLLGAVAGRPGGLVLLGLVAVLALGVTSAVDRYGLDRGSSVTAAPGSAAGLADDYSLVAGELTLDLTRIRDLQALDGRSVRVRAEAGEVDVTVPVGLDVRVDALTRVGGRVDVEGTVDEGRAARVTTFLDGGDDAPVLTLDADLSVGRIEVHQATEAITS